MRSIKVINFTVLFLLYFIFFYKNWKKEGIKKFIIKTLMYLYIVLVIYVTLMPWTGVIWGFITKCNGKFLETANFIPFIDLRLGRKGARKEIILNIIMLLPFGFLYPFLKDKKTNLFKVTLASFLLSLTIECSQLLGVYLNSISPRAFDVTDLITNTIGGMLGYMLFKVFGFIFEKIINLIEIKIKEIYGTD